jgi:hypothetical protein
MNELPNGSSLSLNVDDAGWRPYTTAVLTAGEPQVNVSSDWLCPQARNGNRAGAIPNTEFVEMAELCESCDFNHIYFAESLKTGLKCA